MHPLSCVREPGGSAGTVLSALQLSTGAQVQLSQHLEQQAGTPESDQGRPGDQGPRRASKLFATRSSNCDSAATEPRVALRP